MCATLETIEILEAIWTWALTWNSFGSMSPHSIYLSLSLFASPSLSLAHIHQLCLNIFIWCGFIFEFHLFEIPVADIEIDCVMWCSNHQFPQLTLRTLQFFFHLRVCTAAVCISLFLYVPFYLVLPIYFNLADVISPYFHHIRDLAHSHTKFPSTQFHFKFVRHSSRFFNLFHWFFACNEHIIGMHFWVFSAVRLNVWCSLARTGAIVSGWLWSYGRCAKFRIEISCTALWVSG